MKKVSLKKAIEILGGTDNERLKQWKNILIKNFIQMFNLGK